MEIRRLLREKKIWNVDDEKSKKVQFADVSLFDWMHI